MSYFTIHIPTKPYLAKYIATRYGSPVLLNNKSFFGIVVLSLLQKKVCTHLNLSKKHLQFSNFTTAVTCQAPYRYMNSYGFDLTDDQIIQLNRSWNTTFAEDLYFHCQNSISKEGRYKGYDTAIEQFANLYNIEIDIDATFECLKKIEYRYRKEREKADPMGNKKITLKTIPDKFFTNNYIPQSVNTPTLFG